MRAENTDVRILKQRLAHCLTPEATMGLIIMTGLMATTLVVANLAATKIWSLAAIPVDGGILLFPLSYILGDLLVEIYGQKRADEVAWVGCCMGGLTILLIYLVGLLPDYPGADNSGFLAIKFVTGRIFAASLVGFIASQLLNNYLFEKTRRRQKKDSFWRRAFASSALAHIPDILLFEPIAFWGKLSFQDFVKQAVFAYGAAIVLEVIILTVATQHLARYMVKRLRFRHGMRA